MGVKELLTGKIEVRFGWDAFSGQYSGGLIAGLRNKATSVDCDAGALLCGEDGKPISSVLSECFINYAVPDMFDSALIHHGDNQTGKGEDDEIISIDLSRIPAHVRKIYLIMDLFKEKKKRKHGNIQNTFVRITTSDTGEEIARTEFNILGAGNKLVQAGMILREEDDHWFFDPSTESYSVKSMDEFIMKKFQLQYE